ncbi:hypothetical protein G6M89_20410 [Natronolimnobius sp. AArcel1]|uniref:phage NrS-1 polymerase family protein n=1 Tax=Natronolimnobius sp. AArcel1 TaxID=1679093 RepID=UPI0013EC6BB7|nr:hypothetical protein [Natronolimnobius sp. AArcel1]NGM71333.1 hypothetical protein [Natronolimnobius sp. AArcel1]
MNNQNEDKFDIEAIPDELAERPQWICWRAEDRDGKTTKVPVDPTTGSFASTTDDRTWTTLDQALEYVVTGADGIGFVFTATDPLVGVDLDDCRDPETGKPLEPAPSIIDQLDSFTEVSPSGTGYHVLLEGDLPDGRNRHGSLEMYDHARFFTVTADHVSGTPTSVNERQEALEAVHEECIASEVSGAADTVEANPPATESREQSLGLEDEELLEKARNASNGEKFDRLWRGSTAGYDSQSEADMALCCLLAFWTGGDAARVDQLFRQSGLLRDKWDEVHYSDGSTYGEKTVERAIASTEDVYTPSSGNETSTGGAQTTAAQGTSQDGPTSTTERTVSGTDGARAAYLAEKNQLLNERVSALEATLEQKDERIEELEDENTALRESLETCTEQLEDPDQLSALEDAGTDNPVSVWNRTKRFFERSK